MNKLSAGQNGMGGIHNRRICMHKRRSCIFLLMLIFSLPLQSAVAFAEIRKAGVHGIDNIDGYRRTLKDRTIIEAEARLSGDTDITPEQLRINARGRITQFRECAKMPDGFTKCTYSTSPNSLEDEAKAYQFTVQLYSDANTLADERQLELTYDNQPPKIFIDRIIQDKDVIQIPVHTEDIACIAAGCEGRCVGLKSLEVDGISQNISGCSASQIVSMPAKVEGSRTYTVKAADMFSQMSTLESSQFFVDGKDPVIEKKITFLLDGQPIRAIGEEGIRSAWAVAQITEHELAGATADFSSLNRLPEFQALYKEMKAECIRMSTERFQCTWKNIYLLPEKQASIIQINATDVAGRKSSESFAVELPLDAEKPKITRLTTSGCINDKCYVALKGNVIRADIEERGVGFSPFTFVDGEPRYRIGIDAHELSSAYNVLWADNCTGNGGSWTCFWNDIRADGPHLRELGISVPALSTDDAGNTFTGDATKRIIVDAEPPIIIEANASSEQGSMLLEDSQLTITAVLKDDTNIRGKAYAEQVIGIKEPVTIECIPSDGTHICKWSNIGKLLPGPIKDAKIKLVFTDMGGNSIEKVLPVDVLASEKEKKNYWQLAGKPVPMPRVVDKDSLFFEQRVYFTIPLTGPANAKIIDGGILDCADNTGFSTVRILSADGNSLLLQTTVGPIAPDATLSKIHATCTASVVTVINNERLAMPQELMLRIEVPLVSTTPGALDDVLQKKIEDAKNWDLYGLRKIFKPLEQLYKIAEQICNGLSLFSQSAYGGALGAYNLMSSRSSSGLGALGPGMALAAQSNSKMFSGAYKYCQYLSCDKTLWNNWYDKFIKEPEWSKKAHLGATAWPQNPKDNLFLSMATGCIPGILYNLNKYKQLQCIYVDCLQNQVPQGIPMQYCVNQHEYLKCRFVYGQVFDLIPFAHFVKRMAIYMKTIFANPLSMVFGLGSFACEQKYAGLGTNGMLCAIARTLPQALGTVNQLKQLGNFQGDLLQQGRAQNVCGKVGME